MNLIQNRKNAIIFIIQSIAFTSNHRNFILGNNGLPCGLSEKNIIKVKAQIIGLLNK